MNKIIVLLSALHQFLYKKKAQTITIFSVRPCTASIHKWEVCAVGRILLVNRFALIISFRGASSTEKVSHMSCTLCRMRGKSNHFPSN